MYVIVKHVKTQNNRTLPVIMLDTQSEVWEFDNKDKAQEMVNILNTNTDSGHKYEVKKVWWHGPVAQLDRATAF